VLGEESPAAPEAGEGSGIGGEAGAPEKTNPEAKKRKGHGRNGAEKFPTAQKVKVPHGSLKSGVHCPGCAKGKVYPLKEPNILVRITGMAPLGATVYECERLRCNLCGEVFSAPPPPGVGEEKYDASAIAMVGCSNTAPAFPSIVSSGFSRRWRFRFPPPRSGIW